MIRRRRYDDDYEAKEEERQKGGVLDRGRCGLLKGGGIKNIEMENCSQDNCGKYLEILR